MATDAVYSGDTMSTLKHKLDIPLDKIFTPIENLPTGHCACGLRCSTTCYRKTYDELRQLLRREGDDAHDGHFITVSSCAPNAMQTGRQLRKKERFFPMCDTTDEADRDAAADMREEYALTASRHDGGDRQQAGQEQDEVGAKLFGQSCWSEVSMSVPSAVGGAVADQRGVGAGWDWFGEDLLSMKKGQPVEHCFTENDLLD